MQHPGELSLPADRHFANRQMERERRPVTAAAGDLTTDPDDRRLPGREIPGEVAVVLFVIGRGHQDVDVTPDDLGSGIAE